MNKNVTALGCIPILNITKTPDDKYIATGNLHTKTVTGTSRNTEIEANAGLLTIMTSVKKLCKSYK